MSEITAVFENGVLRPLSPLTLGEGQRVRLQVLEEPPVLEDALETALQPFVASGLLIYPPCHANVASVSEAELQQMTESLKGVSGKPLSEVIIEDRGELCVCNSEVRDLDRMQ